MELVLPTCEKIGEMFILILAGIVSCKAGLLDEDMSKKLSNLLLMVVCPCLIINSYQIDYRPELFIGLVLCLLFSGISFALDVLVAHVVIRPDSGRDEAHRTHGDHLFQLRVYRHPPGGGRAGKGRGVLCHRLSDGV